MDGPYQRREQQRDYSEIFVRRGNICCVLERNGKGSWKHWVDGGKCQ